jgi:SAM-dependent methyltransferase
MTGRQEQIAEYYGRAFAAHGDTPRGMDWNSEEAQTLRFEKLLQHLPLEGARLLDVGCGTGELYALLRRRGAPIAQYVGIDLVQPMIQTASGKFAGDVRAAFRHGGLDSLGSERFDIVVASGIFNVKQDAAAEAWETYVFDTIRAMYARADRAIAFNLLTDLADADRRAPHLYYADPGRLLRFSRAEMSRFVVIDHGYKFFEFTATIYHGPA